MAVVPLAALGRGRECSGEEPDRAAWSWRFREPAVAGQQPATEQFGERDVGSVVCGDVGPEFVGAAHEWQGWVAVEVEVFEILDGNGEALVADGPGQPALAEHGRRLDIDEVRRG